MKQKILYLFLSIISFLLIIAIGTIAFTILLTLLFAYATIRVLVHFKKNKPKKNPPHNMKDVTKSK